MADLSSRRDALNFFSDASQIVYAKAAIKFLADLEHELRFPRHPVWLGLADGQYERHLWLSGRERGFPRHPLAGRARHRRHHPAVDRPVQRPLLDPAGPAASVYPRRRDS